MVYDPYEFFYTKGYEDKKAGKRCAKISYQYRLTYYIGRGDFAEGKPNRYIIK